MPRLWTSKYWTIGDVVKVISCIDLFLAFILILSHNTSNTPKRDSGAISGTSTDEAVLRSETDTMSAYGNEEELGQNLKVNPNDVDV